MPLHESGRPLYVLGRTANTQRQTLWMARSNHDAATRAHPVTTTGRAAWQGRERVPGIAYRTGGVRSPSVGGAVAGARSVPTIRRARVGPCCCGWRDVDVLRRPG